MDFNWMGDSSLLDHPVHVDDTLRRVLLANPGFPEANVLRETENQRLDELMMSDLFWLRELEMEFWEILMMERETAMPMERNYGLMEQSPRPIWSYRDQQGFEEGGPWSHVNLVETRVTLPLLDLFGNINDGQRDAEVQLDPGASVYPIHKPTFDLNMEPNVAPVESLRSCDVGTKRKSETHSAHESEETDASSEPEKPHKEIWNCSLCQVSVDGEQAFQDHLNRKKHKSNHEAFLLGKSMRKIFKKCSKSSRN